MASLEELLNPSSVALIGASDRVLYSAFASHNLDVIGYPGKVFAVNPRGVEAHGRPGVSSCRQIGEPVDLGYVMVPQRGVLDAAADAIAGGVRNLAVLTSGFAEVGEEGARLQDRLVAMCREAGVGLLGPNCLGFINYLDRVAVGSIPVLTPQPAEGGLAIVSASGATASQLLTFAHQQGIGASHVIATGNECGFTSADLVAHLVEDERVRAIALFMEMVREPETLRRAALRARDLKKPIVVLKVGASEATAAVVAAHTGSMVGDDRVFDAACERLGLVRVAGFEELVATAHALGSTGPLPHDGVSFISISGGGCEVMSDQAAAAGVPVPPYAEQTRAALGEALSDLGQSHNPLDLTGGAVRDPTIWTRSIAITSADPEVGLVAIHTDLPAEPGAADAHHQHIAAGIAAAVSPALILTSFVAPLQQHGLATRARMGVPVLPGMAIGMKVIAHLVRWSRRLREPLPAAPATVAADPAVRAGTLRTEREVLEFLGGRGVPVIPGTVARSPAEAMAAARALGGPVVLKVHSPEIAHKSDIGGVRLGLDGDAAVAAAWEEIVAQCRSAMPAAAIDEVIVSPMRARGTELFVGVARDAVWGPVLAIGLGGVWVEALEDTRLLLLPARREEIVRAFRELRAARLLDGYRGAPPVDLEAVADAVARIGDAALALGPDLAALEVNPLLAGVGGVEALDGLVLWEERP